MPTSIRFRRRKTLVYTTHSSFLERVKSGSEEAWRDFYDRYVGMVRLIGKKRRLSPEECDELMNDVMLIFWKKMADFHYDRRRGKFRTYLGRIANYAAFKIFARSRRQSVAVRMVPEEYPDDIDRSVMEEWRNFLLENALADLKETVDTEVYQVFYMSAVQHRSVAEIANVTRKTPNNIYVIRSRCFKKLQEILAAYRKQGDIELAPRNSRPDETA